MAARLTRTVLPIVLLLAVAASCDSGSPESDADPTTTMPSESVADEEPSGTTAERPPPAGDTPIEDAGGEQVTICHRTNGSEPWTEITISASAIDAHLNHPWGADIIPAPEGGCPDVTTTTSIIATTTVPGSTTTAPESTTTTPESTTTTPESTTTSVPAASSTTTTAPGSSTTTTTTVPASSSSSSSTTSVPPAGSTTTEAPTGSVLPPTPTVVPSSSSPTTDPGGSVVPTTSETAGTTIPDELAPTGRGTNTSLLIAGLLVVIGLGALRYARR